MARHKWAGVRWIELSDFLPIDISPVAYSEDEDITLQDRIDYSIVADSIFSKAGKLPFESWIQVCILGKLFLNLI